MGAPDNKDSWHSLNAYYGKLFNFFSLLQWDKTKTCFHNRLLIINEYIPEQKISLGFREHSRLVSLSAVFDHDESGGFSGEGLLVGRAGATPPTLRCISHKRRKSQPYPASSPSQGASEQPPTEDTQLLAFPQQPPALQSQHRCC